MKLFATSLLAALLALPAMSSFAAGEAPAPAHAPAVAEVAKPDLVKGAATFAAVCVSCHGADGNSGTPAYPKLAQQHPQYLIKQLQEFKSGKRKNSIMVGFASALSDEDMKNIAYFVGSKKAAPSFSKKKSWSP